MPFRLPALRRPTTDQEDIAARKRLIERTIQQRDDIESYFNDVKHWNTQVRRPGEAPIDPDPDGELREMLQAFNAVLVADGETRLM